MRDLSMSGDLPVERGAAEEVAGGEDAGRDSEERGSQGGCKTRARSGNMSVKRGVGRRRRERE